MTRKLIWKGTLAEAEKHPLFALGKEETLKQVQEKIRRFINGPLRAYCSMCDYSQEEFKELVKQFEELKKSLRDLK